MEILRGNNISHLPVVDAQGNVLGIISEVDLLSTGPSRVTTLSFYEIYTLLDEITLSQIMTKPVLAVEGDCSLPTAASYMIENDVGSLLVVEGSELVGIITRTDIFKTLVEILGGGQPGARVEIRVADEKGMLAQATQAFADAGSYIYSLATFQDEQGKYTLASVKQAGATQESLREAMAAREGVELLSFRPVEENRLIRLNG